MLPSHLDDRELRPAPPPENAPARAIDAALALARATGEPALIRVHHRADVADPWDLLGHPALDGRLLAAWADGTDGRCFVGGDTALRFDLHGPDRFREAVRVDRLLRDRCFEAAGADQDAVDPHAPLFLAGFAFAEGGAHGPAWEGWSDGELFVPRFLLHTTGGRVALAIVDAVSPTDTRAAVEERLARRTSKALALLRRPRRPGDLREAPSVPSAGHEAGDRAAWRGRVDTARDALARGAFEKVVLARCETYRALDGLPFDPLATAVALRGRQARCITFAWRRPDGSAFVGATPEVLVRLSDRQVSTVALAGTARRGEGADDDALAEGLLASAKDRAEHDHVVRAIEGALAPIATALEVPAAPAIARFADVQHLETRIRATVPDGHSLFDLVGRLHPTPAVGGLPSEPALGWMAAHEGLDRGWYAGPVGWSDAAGTGVFAVAIRSVVLRGERAWAYAGCGLVTDSDADAEWRETVTKLRAVRHGLAVAVGEPW